MRNQENSLMADKFIQMSNLEFLLNIKISNTLINKQPLNRIHLIKYQVSVMKGSRILWQFSIKVLLNRNQLPEKQSIVLSRPTLMSGFKTYSQLAHHPHPRKCRSTIKCIPNHLIQVRAR